MKTFIFSYLVSVLPLIYAFLPSFQVSPFEAIARICFYLAFPLAIALSLVIIAIKQYLGFNVEDSISNSDVHRAADNAALNTGVKVS